MGVVDQGYIEKSGDLNAIVGRKIAISKEDVCSTVSIVQELAKYLADSLRSNEAKWRLFASPFDKLLPKLLSGELQTGVK